MYRRCIHVVPTLYQRCTNVGTIWGCPMKMNRRCFSQRLKRRIQDPKREPIRLACWGGRIFFRVRNSIFRLGVVRRGDAGVLNRSSHPDLGGKVLRCGFGGGMAEKSFILNWTVASFFGVRNSLSVGRFCEWGRANVF